MEEGGEESSERAEWVRVPKEELEASAGEVLDLLYEILEAEGQTPNGATLSKQDKVSLSLPLADLLARVCDDGAGTNTWVYTQARLRLVSAAGVLKLMRNPEVQHRLLTTSRQGRCHSFTSAST